MDHLLGQFGRDDGRSDGGVDIGAGVGAVVGTAKTVHPYSDGLLVRFEGAGGFATLVIHGPDVVQRRRQPPGRRDVHARASALPLFLRGLMFHLLTLCSRKLLPGNQVIFFKKNNGGTHYSPSQYSASASPITFILQYHFPLYLRCICIWFDNSRRSSSLRILTHHFTIAFLSFHDEFHPIASSLGLGAKSLNRARHPIISSPIPSTTSLSII